MIAVKHFVKRVNNGFSEELNEQEQQVLVDEGAELNVLANFTRLMQRGC